MGWADTLRRSLEASMKRMWTGSWVTIALIAFPSLASPDWNVDPGPTGLLVRNGGSPRSVVSDGAGGALIGFNEYYGSNTVHGIVVQRLESHGLLPWGSNGATVGIIGFIPNDYGPWMVADGAGGAIVIWRFPVPSPHLQGQHVDANGTVLWTPSGPQEGLHLASVQASFLPIWVGQDGAGSFIAVWFQGSPAALFAQRFDGNGTTFWGPMGLDLGISTSSLPGLVSDGSGGLIIFWSAPGAGGDRDLFAQRFGRDGAPMWAAGGVVICSAAGEQGLGSPSIAAVSDGAGGAFVTWLDQRVDSQGDVYAQRVDASGTIQWATNGLALCSITGAQTVLHAVSDGSGGMIAAWQDGRDSPSAGTDLYAQRVVANGLSLWAAGGAPICSAPNEQFVDQATGESNWVAADGNGGLFAAWTDSRPDASPGNDIFAQHLSGTGTALWPGSGLRFAATSATLGRPAVMPDGAGGCAVLWGADFDLKARGSSGPVVGIGSTSPSFALRGPRPNPAVASFAVDFSLTEPGTVRLDIFDVAGRLTWHRDESGLGPGPHVLRVGVLKPGLYFVRLQQGSRIAIARAAVVR
jgi:hypothetical protein